MRTILLLFLLFFPLLAQDPPPVRSWAFLFSPAHSAHDADDPKPVYDASVSIVFEVKEQGYYRVDLVLVTKETAGLPEPDQDVSQVKTAELHAGGVDVARGSMTAMVPLMGSNLIIKVANVFKMQEVHHSQVTAVQ